MPIIESGLSNFRPYARLISLLGDQLITDKIVALVEVVKNSYDADATKVIVEFGSYDEIGYESNRTKSNYDYIEIKDDGMGMSKDTILNVYLNPGTPNKLVQKNQERRTPIYGRTMQGEKGIGRFATNKLGTTLNIYSKNILSDEVRLTVDFNDYDPDPTPNVVNKVDGPELNDVEYSDASDDGFQTQLARYKHLDEVFNKYEVYKPPLVFPGGPGTLIRIEGLNQTWSDHDLKNLHEAFQRLCTPPDILQEEFNPSYDAISDFVIDLVVGGKSWQTDSEPLRDLLEVAPFTMFGEIDDDGMLSYRYACSGLFGDRNVEKSIDMLSPSKYGVEMPAIKHRFGDRTKNEIYRSPMQGKIKFSFYVFERRPGVSLLTKAQKELLNQHSVYVLRDGIRVYPFGEQEHDWLELGKRRSQEKAGWYYSYNDIIGFVYITGKDNPRLKDTSSRFGIMDVEGAYDDFRALLLGSLNIMKSESDLDKKRFDLVSQPNISAAKDVLKSAFTNFIKIASKQTNLELLDAGKALVSAYDENHRIIDERLQTYQDLAGLGLAVEKSSHDALLNLSRTMASVRELQKLLTGPCLSLEVATKINDISEAMAIVYNELQVIQPLFRTARRVAVDVDLLETCEKAIRYFSSDLSKGHIGYQLIGKENKLTIKSPKGILLQVLINLIDNAIFWLNESRSNDKKIVIRIDAQRRNIVVADNGVGIASELSDIVFEAFFTRRAEGRGLGLHISKELLARIGASISLAFSGRNHILPGANFLIQF